MEQATPTKCMAWGPHSRKNKEPKEHLGTGAIHGGNPQIKKEKVNKNSCEMLFILSLHLNFSATLSR